MRMVASDAEDAGLGKARRHMRHYQAGQAWQMAYEDQAGGGPRTFRPGMGGLLALSLSNAPSHWVVAASDAQAATLLGKELSRAIHRMTGSSPGGRAQTVALPGANPSRLAGMALPAHTWVSVCIHFDRAPLGMLLIGDAYLWVREARELMFARVHSPGDETCRFCATGAKHEIASTRPALMSALDRVRPREQPLAQWA